MKKTLLFLFVLVCSHSVYSEGTKQIWPSGLNAERQYLLYNSLTGALGDWPTGQYNCAADYRINIEIETLGEVIHLGFMKHNVDASNLYYRIKNAAGTVVYGPINMPKVADPVGPGKIQTHAEALAGPASIVGGTGYNDAMYTPTVTGTFYIEFSAININGPPVNERHFVRYWDISVSKAGVIQTGRLWSKSWMFSGDSFAPIRSYATIYPYSNDGVVSKLELNGLAPYDFFIETNSTGPRNTGNPLTDRQSVNGKQNAPEYKIFLNDPDSSLFPTGEFSSLESNEVFMSGCGSPPTLGVDNYCINVKYSGSGLASLDLDLPPAGPGSEDITLTENVTAGWNCFAWDGFDGNGVVSLNNIAITSESTILAGVTHYPLFDAEDNADGFIISAVRPNVPVTTAYFDDTNVGGADATAGVPIPAHTWSSGCNCSAGVGEQNTLNTWWFGVSIKDTVQFLNSICSPTAVDDAGSVQSGNTVTIDVLANDFDGNGDNFWPNTMGSNSSIDNYLSVRGATVTRNDNGTPADSTDDLMDYTAPANFQGVDTVYYIVFDTPNSRDTAMVIIMVWNDLDGDGIVGALDIDGDNDGIKDVDEDGGTGVNPALDVDGDGIPNYLDPDLAGFVDTNADGVNDNYDSDLDGIPDFLDLDADNDGIPDIVEAGGVDINGDGFIDSNIDTDGDGLNDPYDTDNGGSNIALYDTDADGVPDYLDLDSDNDGIADITEAGGLDTARTGRVNAYTDTDGDGFHDPYDGDVGNDGTAENSSSALQLTGTDTDADGMPNSYPEGDFDGDGYLDQLDIDSDGDGISDNVEGHIEGNDRPPLGVDTDGDGWDDRYDSDNGGFTIVLSDRDGDGKKDYKDLDSDGDSILDAIEGHDANNDGVADTTPTGTDTDGDGLDDAYDTVVRNFANRHTNSRGSNAPKQNFDGDGARDWRDTDDDQDGIPTISEPINIQGAAVVDYLEVSSCPIRQTQQSTTISGNADAVHSSGGGAANVNLALGAPDGDDTGAILNAGDWMILDLTDVIPAGQTVVITVARRQTTGGTSGIIFEQSLDATFVDDENGAGDNPSTYTSSVNIPTFETFNYVISGADARYIRATRSSRGNVLDAISYSYIGTTCVADWDMDGISDAIDIDDDNDGIRDAIEGMGDFDGDGIADQFDLDSDNDGIPDAIEANGGFLPAGMNGNGQYSVAFVADLTNDANSDGYVSTSTETGTFTTFNPDVTDLNTEGTGNPDRLDLDSDGDGLLDGLEANSGTLPTGMDATGQYLPGYMAANDANGDGVADAIDVSVGGTPLLVPDTDSDGLKDYRDLDSDADGTPDATEGTADANCNGKPDYIDSSLGISSALAGNWSTPGTWAGGVVPTASDNVVIGHAVSVTGAVLAHDLTINGSVTLTNTGTLTLTGNLTVTGSYSGAGTINLTGTCGAQTISGEFTVRNLTVTNPSGATISNTAADTIEIAGVLNLAGGSLTTGGNELVLGSDANRTATVKGTGGNIVGDVTYERYVTDGGCPATDGFIYLASPVTTTTYADWFDDGFWFTGFTGVYDATGWPNVYSYAETTIGEVDSGFVSPSNANQTIARGLGYTIYAWRDAGMLPVTTYTKGAVSLDPFTWNDTPSGSDEALLTFTNDPAVDDNIHDGWNLLGNPYPGAIDWNSPSWTKVGCCDAVYSYDACADAYASFSGGVGVNTHDGKIAQGQSFWVKAHSAGASMSITNAAIATTGGQIFKKSAPKNVLKLKVSGGVKSDEIAIRLSDETTKNFDNIQDAPKFYLATDKPAMYTELVDDNNEPMKYAINSFNKESVSQLPVKVRVAETKKHTLYIEGGNSFDETMCVFIKDELTGDIIDPKVTTSYEFTMDAKAEFEDRFVVSFDAIQKPVVTTAICGNDGKIEVALNTKSDYTLINDKSVVVSSGKAVTSIFSENLEAGQYQLVLTKNGLACTNRHTIDVSGNKPVVVSSIVAQAVTCDNNDGEVTVTATGGSGGYSYNWSNGATTNHVENLKPANYFVTIKDINNCEAKAGITVSSSYLIADFAVDQDTLDLSSGQAVLGLKNTSINSLDQVWSFGDGEISYAKNPTKTYTTKGDYIVSLTVESGNNCLDSITKTIIVKDEILAINEIENNPIKVYTTGNGIVFSVVGKVDYKIAYTLYTLEGNVLLSKSFEEQNRLTSYAINTSELSAGVYVLSLQIGNKTVSRKISISK